MIDTYRFGCRCAGLSLVELMVAIAISSILLAGVGNIYVGNKTSYLVAEENARMQENARFALDALAKDIRMAGYRGCDAETTRFANTLNGATSWMTDLESGIIGYEGGVDTFPPEFSASAMGTTDAITVVRADSDDSYIVASHNPTAASLQLAGNHDLKRGEILVITDCDQTSIFQQSNTNINDTISVVVHNTGAPTTPGNCTKKLFTDPSQSRADCSDVSDFDSVAFGGDAMLMRLLSNSYFIGLENGIPTLYQEGITHGPTTTTTLSTTRRALVQGVQDMQILYGEDTAGADGVPDQFKLASAVADWKDVVAVRLSLLLRSERELNTTPQSYTFAGTTTTPVDRYIRRVFTSTIKLRNRGDR